MGDKKENTPDMKIVFFICFFELLVGELYILYINNRVVSPPFDILPGWKMKFPLKNGPFFGDVLIFGRVIQINMGFLLSRKAFSLES